MMAEKLRLMAILAHPDDESLGFGGTLAKYADEGIETALVTATRGQAGWHDPEAPHPGSDVLGKLREAELVAAAGELGIKNVTVLDYEDGRLDQADPNEVVPKLVGHIQRFRPHVVVTFDPFGAYGHPDHIAICQLTSAALVQAASQHQAGGSESQMGAPPHVVPKFYYRVYTREQIAHYESVIGSLAIEVKGHKRSAPGWSPWAVASRIDTAAYWRQTWQAVTCHRTQLPSIDGLLALSDEELRELFGTQDYYRVYSIVNGGAELEDDLFAGLR